MHLQDDWKSKEQTIDVALETERHRVVTLPALPQPVHGVQLLEPVHLARGPSVWGRHTRLCHTGGGASSTGGGQDALPEDLLTFVEAARGLAAGLTCRIY